MLDENGGNTVMASQLNNIRLKLEEKRRHIENEKRRMEVVMSKQRQKVGKAAFLQAVTKVKHGITPNVIPMDCVIHTDLFKRHYRCRFDHQLYYSSYTHIIVMVRALMVCFFDKTHIERNRCVQFGASRGWLSVSSKHNIKICHAAWQLLSESRHGCLV